MTYTINPNAKNVWIRNNEDTMDLSPITDASTVYLENGRTLEQELGEGSMVSNVATVDCAMSRVTEGTYDGAYESCVFKGKSLVNLGREKNSQYHNISGEGTQITSDGYFKIPYAGSENSHSVRLKFGLLEPLIKPDTVYSLIVEIVENTTQNARIGFTEHNNLSCVEPVDKNTNIASAVGTHVKLIKRRSEVTARQSDLYFCIWDKANVDATKHIKFRYMILEGDWTNKELPPYFEGICDVKMPILQNTGENLFDPNSPLPDNLNYFYNSDNKNQLTTHAQMLSCAIPVIKGKTYSFYFNHDEIPLKVHKSGVFPTFVSGGVGGNGYAHNVRTITAPMDGYFGIMFCYTEDGTTDNWTKVARDWKKQLKLTIVEGKSINTYIPYKTNILTTTRKNLFDMNRPYDVITDSQATVVQSLDKITVSSAESGIYVNANFILDKDFFAGKTVTGSCLYESDEKGIGTVQITYQDGNGDHHYQWIKTPRTFTFPNSFIGDVMLSISANNTDTPQSNTVTVKNIQLELGSTATSYEPYSEVVLRGIGDVQDTYNALTGEYTQRIGEIILDGSDNETWGNYEVKGDNVKFAYCPTLVAQGSYQFVECLCDKWKADNQANETIQEQISLYNHMSNNTPQTEVRITVSPTRLQSVDVTGFRAWLSQNPLTVQYILAEPVTTIVEPSTIPFAYENGHVILESGFEGQSLLPALEYSTVANRIGQVESVAKVIQKQEKQLTMLEQMLIQNIIELDYNNTVLALNLEINEVM